MSDTPAALEVLSPGAYASLQDRGRRGLRRVGVPWSGVLHAERHLLANALVENPPEAPSIEHFDGGLHLHVRQGPVTVAVTGEAEVEIVRAGIAREAACWRGHRLATDDRLRVRRVRAGRLVYVAVGALQAPSVLGSASTYARAGIGRPLAPGDVLQAGAGSAPERELGDVPDASTTAIRVVPGPQDDHFTPAALDELTSASYAVTDQADRMGVRLSGPALEHRSAAQREIVSDATVPGSIQVPGNGQPIVLLADAQTAGGYPKIATVISVDLGRVADLRPGTPLRFTAVTVAQAEDAARADAARLAARLARIRDARPDGEIDLERLYDDNLISGVCSALAKE